MERRVFKGGLKAQFAVLAGMAPVLLASMWGSFSHRTDSLFDYPMAVGLLAVVVAGLSLLTIAKPTILELDEDGLTWRAWTGTVSFRWIDVDRFAGMDGAFGPQSRIAFTFLPGKNPQKVVGPTINQQTRDYDWAMSNVWAIDTPDLVFLMNSYLARERASLGTAQERTHGA